ncbi:NAD(P)H-flavin reductase [Legionella micdadei]|uniref:CDP-4-dehydro-6-deoxyglucose reductase n=1 Tax=Legionella micdadei TaxID=451 RepID=A0A098GIR4_LEGMI|nr:NAD(P)H-flavin reductase [Legionella micdadei]ARG98752.1 NAD(P)H-flavin reductase [Legionella micdadei]ARH01471.1 NAD(P)H-flavin reductase [Legionella micdadei]KTD28975.1 CDP-6-deoxy-delta-3,4-glucoseen reductase [Legionella micdadei]CEG62358.1 CDP-6-deoxy-3,4-glucoseen reductase [Legionella micdadei]SCY02406.1 CDP-4-dehydro-6-deoxyglucose reductase [Legionella micdadei]
MSIKSVRAQVDSIVPLTDSILQLILAPEHYIDYQAGQYLEIVSDGEALSYSIANAPLGSHKYELHIRHSADNLYNQHLLSEIKQSGVVTIRLPLGDCYLNKLDESKPILFIAGGTGFAPIKAMIEQLLATSDKRAFELFWGARSQSDLYMNEKVSHWQSHVAQFRYFSLLSNSSKDTLASIVLEQHQMDLKKWQFVIGGPFDMVYATRDVLVARGVSPKQLFSDAFSFEKKGIK